MISLFKRHLPEFLLMDYAEGSLEFEKDNADMVEKHFSSCAKCKKAAAGLKEVVALSKSVKKGEDCEINPFLMPKIIDQLNHSPAFRTGRRYLVPRWAAAFSLLCVLAVVLTLALQPKNNSINILEENSINWYLIKEYTQQNQDEILDLVFKPDDEKEFQIYEKFYYFVKMKDSYTDISVINENYDYMLKNLDEMI